MDILKDVIEAKLNVRISDLIQRKVEDLNELKDVDIERARMLGQEYEAEYYLGLLATDDNARYLKGFVRSVITNKEDHRTWGKGSVLLLLDSSLHDVLTKERNVLFNRSDDELKHIIEPEVDAWNRNSDTSGAFAFLIPEINYRFTSPAGYLMRSPDGVQLSAVSPGRVILQFRRWIASKIAGYLNYFNQLNTAPDLSVLEEIAPRESWTEDALMALSGLLKEIGMNPLENGKVPGFYGPDDFYV
jgi:hypothetical protein